MIVKFDMRGAYESGHKDHPQKVMKDLGFEVSQSEAIPIADCWIFTITNCNDMTLPHFLTSIDFTYSK